MNTNLLYQENKYFEKNPTLHEEDSHWKISKILPLIDKLFNDKYITKNEIILLDVGGGAGIILKEVAEYITYIYGVRVNKICLDLSPGMLNVQKKNNPDAKLLNEDICNTTLKNGSIDIILMIDVLEHIPDWKMALEELRRVTNFVIFKVPLERNLVNISLNYLKQGDVYKKGVESVGHINWYNLNDLDQGIETHFGHILDFFFTNVFDYYGKNYSNIKFSKLGKIANSTGKLAFFLSPTLCSRLFPDFVMILGVSRSRVST